MSATLTPPRHAWCAELTALTCLELVQPLLQPLAASATVLQLHRKLTGLISLLLPKPPGSSAQWRWPLAGPSWQAALAPLTALTQLHLGHVTHGNPLIDAWYEEEAVSEHLRSSLGNLQELKVARL